MNILLVQRIVKRCTDPSNPQYNQVISAYAKLIDAYSSNIIPRKGEVILVDGNLVYDVVEVIYQRHVKNKFDKEAITVTLEVVPHVNTQSYDAGNHSFVEEWPLITNLPADLSSSRGDIDN